MDSIFKRGVFSGVAATIPMSLFTHSLFRKFSSSKKDEKKKDLVLLVHFGYGILTSLVYATFAKHFKFQSPFKEGIAFGLSTWAASYGGLTPLYNLRDKTEEMIEKRKVTMTMAHVAWGICLAMIENKLRNHSMMKRNTLNVTEE